MSVVFGSNTLNTDTQNKPFHCAVYYFNIIEIVYEALQGKGSLVQYIDKRVCDSPCPLKGGSLSMINLLFWLTTYLAFKENSYILYKLCFIQISLLQKGGDCI